jgi:hypothetical protein
MGPGSKKVARSTMKIQKQENGQGLGIRKLCKLYRKRERKVGRR